MLGAMFIGVLVAIVIITPGAWIGLLIVPSAFGIVFGPIWLWMKLDGWFNKVK
jgi:uncharacterized membrane protein (DUF4010 family)